MMFQLKHQSQQSFSSRSHEQTLVPKAMTTERLQFCSSLTPRSELKELQTCSVASNSSTSCTGGAGPGSDSGVGVSEEVSLELENLKDHFGRRIDALEGEFHNRIERLEDRISNMCAETRDECKDEVLQVQAGVLAIAEKAANLASVSKRECERIDARTKWCCAQSVEDMLSKKLEEANICWEASVSQLKAVSEERWWGIQAHVGVLSTKIEDLSRECKLSKLSKLSKTSLSLKDTNSQRVSNSLHSTTEVTAVDGVPLGSMLISADMLQPASDHGDAVCAPPIGQHAFGDTSLTLPPASMESLPSSESPYNKSLKAFPKPLSRRGLNLFDR